jgi:ABC-type dipeptide/oligopeptide/nickel transport system permease component
MIVTLNFIIFRIMPGDPRQALMGEGIPPELRQVIAERFGLDRTFCQSVSRRYGILFLSLWRTSLEYYL